MADDDGIGSAGTVPVDPSNPLYDAVKSGGGFVVDEDTGEVTGGPDGDGTARTEEERQNRSNNATSGSGGGSSGGGGGRSRPRSPSVSAGSEARSSKARYGALDDPRVENTGVSGAADGADNSLTPEEQLAAENPDAVVREASPERSQLVGDSVDPGRIPEVDRTATPNKSTQAPQTQTPDARSDPFGTPSPAPSRDGGGGGDSGGGGSDPFGTPSPAPSSNTDGDVDTPVIDAAGDAARFAFGGEEGAFGENNISPSARMSLDEPDAIDARAQKEQDILGQRSADDLGDVPGATAANLFGLGQRVEQAGIGAGEAISDAVPSAEVGPEIGDETLGEVPANIAGGGVAFGGVGLGAALQFPASAADDIDTQLSGDQTPIEAQGGNIDTAATFGETQADMAASYPVSTAAGFFVPGVSGSAGGLRGFRATRGTSGRVDFADITSPRGAEGDLPNFETSPDAPTGRAVDEIETRAGDQPDTINDITGGEDVLFHSTSEPFGRGDFEVGEGASELPGLFTAPDASPLGLSDFGQSRGGTSIGFSDLSTQPEAVPGFVPRGVEGLPRGTGEGGYAVRGPDGEVVETGLSRGEANKLADEIDGERATDPTTAGFDFLTEDAATETGLVRPQGERTTELEAILAPESEFTQQGAVAVDLPDGRTARTDIFGPVDEPGRAGEVDGGVAGEVSGDGGATRTASDISATSGRRSTQPDVAVEFQTNPRGVDAPPTGRPRRAPGVSDEPSWG